MNNKSLITNFRSSKAFSMVEMLLFLMIVGFIILLVVNIPTSINLIGTTRKINLGKEIVNQKIENLRLGGFENLPANGTTAFSDARLSQLSSSAGSVTVSDCPSSICTNSEANIKVVKVEITWTEVGKQRKLGATTLVTLGGIK